MGLEYSKMLRKFGFFFQTSNHPNVNFIPVPKENTTNFLFKHCKPYF